ITPITGTTTVCPGATTLLADATAGGVWSSSNAAMATVSTTGLVTGVSAGTATISYVVTTSCGTARTSTTVTVTPSPNAGTITGTPIVCVTGTTALTDAAPGGTWSSSNSGMATVNTSGLVTGVSAGTVNITYTVVTSCGTAFTTQAVTVSPAP